MRIPMQTLVPDVFFPEGDLTKVQNMLDSKTVINFVTSAYVVGFL